MEELLVKVQEIQQYLYGGYKDEGATNVEWLDVRIRGYSLSFAIFI